MSAQPTDDHGAGEPYEVIHLGGEAAAIVPLAELQRLRAVERHASAEVREEAEIEATLANHRAWVQAGRVRSRTAKRWRNSWAATNEDRMVAGSAGIGTSFHE